MPNLSEAFGVEDVRSHLMHEQAYVDLLRSADPNVYGTFGTLLIFGPRSFDPSSAVLDLLNVTRIAAPPGVGRPDSREAALQDPVYLFSEQTSRVSPVGERPRAPLPIAYSGPDMTLFSRPGAFARFFPVSRVLEGGAPEAAAASREELATTAFVPGGDFAALRNALSGSRPEDARVRIVEYRAEKFALSVDRGLPSSSRPPRNCSTPTGAASSTGGRLRGQLRRALLRDARAGGEAPRRRKVSDPAAGDRAVRDRRRRAAVPHVRCRNSFTVSAANDRHSAWVLALCRRLERVVPSLDPDDANRGGEPVGRDVGLRTEGVAGALDDEGWRPQSRKVLGAQASVFRAGETGPRQTSARTPASSATMLAMRPPIDLPPIASFSGPKCAMTSSQLFGGRSAVGRARLSRFPAPCM